MRDDSDTKIKTATGVYDAARQYLRQGWKPVPIPWRTRHPTHKNWQSKNTTLENIDELFGNGPLNIGVQFGKVSDGLCDVDLDCPEARELADMFLPNTNAMFGRTSSPRAHWLYYADLWESATSATKAFVDPEPKRGDDDHGACLLELRTGRVENGEIKGALSVFPPSMHPSGERVQWDKNGEPAVVDSGELVRACTDLAAATLLARHWPKTGDRQDAARVLGGFLARAKWSDNDIGIFVTAVAKAAKDEEHKKRGATGKDAVAHFAKGGHTPGLPRMRDVFGDKVADRVAEWLNVVTAETSAPTESGKRIEFIRLSDVVPKNIEWFWPNRIPRGQHITATGQPFVGKSLWLLDLAACFTTGGWFPDDTECPDGEVILLTAEDALDSTIVPRLLACGANRARICVLKKIKVDDKTQRRFLLSEDLELLKQEVIKRPRTLMIGIDPITSYVGSKLDSHKMTDMRNVLEPLNELAEATNTLVVSITHPPKTSQNAINAYIGSAAFVAVPRIGYLLAKEIQDDRPTGKCLLTMVGTNIGAMMPTLRYEILPVTAPDRRTDKKFETARIYWEKESIDMTADEVLRSGRHERGESKIAAVMFLQMALQNGPRPQKDLEAEAARMGINERTLRRAFKDIGHAKKIGFRDTWWEWRLKEAVDRP